MREFLTHRQMEKRQKWKRVVLVKRYSSSKNSRTIYCACPITVHVSSSWLCNKWKDGTRASMAWVLFKQYSTHEARVLSQYLIPLFHASVPRWIKKKWYLSSPSSSTTKSGRLLYCLEIVFLGKIFPKLMVMGHFAPQTML